MVFQFDYLVFERKFANIFLQKRLEKGGKGTNIVIFQNPQTNIGSINFNYIHKLKKHRSCAWDLNPGLTLL